MDTNLPTTTEVRRPYTPPQVIVHGTVQDLTQGKAGPDPDLDGTGSAFNQG
jgi:hypothetical protein